MLIGRLLACALGAAMWFVGQVSAHAETPAEFYSEKTIPLLIPFSPGGGTADYGSYVAELLPKYVPGNPKIHIEFMPGAGGMLAHNHFYSRMPRDGTSLLIPDQAIVVAQKLNPNEAQYDVAQLNWLGIATPSRLILFVRKDTGVSNLDQLKSNTIFVGSSGNGSETDFYPRMTNAFLGTKMEVVAGFAGGASEVLNAVEKGEMHGAATGTSLFAQKPHFEALLNPIVTYGAEGRDPFLPNVPNISEIVSEDDDKPVLRFLSSVGVVGRGLITTPDVPEDRLAALRQAFDQVMKDPDFLQKMEKRGFLVREPVSGEEATRVVRQALDVPDAVVERAKSIVSAAN